MPIEHVCAPHSPEWKQLRLGIPTSSNFHRIITPKTRKDSSQRTGYRDQLIAEWWLGEPLDEIQTQWMERGIELEDAALKAFEFDNDVETSAGNFWTTDDRRVGCTPDRLIGANGVLETKCPAPKTQVGYLCTDDLEPDYLCQLQGQLWVLERDVVKIFSYHPRFPNKTISVGRDEDFIRLLSGAVNNFADWLQTTKEEWISKYGEPVRPAPEVATDYLGVTCEDADEIWARRQG